MKKIFLFAALIALLVPTACNKNGGTTETKETILPAPSMAANAKKLIVTHPELRWIELTENSRYIVATAVSKAAEQLEYFRGTYSVSGTKYTLNGFGTLEINGNSLTLSPTGGDPVTLDFKEASKLAENDFFVTVCRAWKVEKTDLSVTTGGSNVGIVKNGCDLHAIAKELVEKGINVNPDRLSGYDVNEINLTRSQTLEIAFKGQNSFVGTYSLSPSGSFSYNMEGQAGNDIFNASASGTVTNKDPYESDTTGKKIWMILNAKLSSGSTTYNGRVIFTLSPAS